MGFASRFRYCTDVAQSGVNQTLHNVWPCPGLAHYLYTFLGALVRNGILAGEKFTGRRLYSEGGHHVGHRPAVYL